jgi:integrase
MQPQSNEKRKHPTGLDVRHSRNCRSVGGGSCNCTPAVRAWVFDRRSGQKIRKTFAGRGAQAAAKAWRAAATTQLGEGKLIAPTRTTVREAAEAWLEGAEAEPPTVLTRSGRPYKPSALREYRRNLENYLLDDLGGQRLSDVRRSDLQALVDGLLGRRLSGSKVRNVIIPLRVIVRHAIERDLVAVNPTSGLKLPAVGEPRQRAASVREAADLLAALPDDVRPIYATAFYGGLRRGELRGLLWKHLDLNAGTISVERGWDDEAGAIATKSAAGNRVVPIAAPLNSELKALQERTGRDGDMFVFGPKAGAPFTASAITKRAAAAWETANEKRKERKLAPLNPIGLHECRHSFSTWLDHADVSGARADRYMGHARSTVASRYRHLRPEQIEADRKKLDAYLAGTASGNVVALPVARKDEARADTA